MAHLPRAGGIVWPPVLASWAPGGTSRGHAHHAMHLLLRARGELRVNGKRAAGVLTAPSVPHAIDASGEDTLLCFVEPESDAGAALLVLLDDRPIRLFSTGERDRLVASLGRAQPMPARAEAWLKAELPHLGAPRSAGAPRSRPKPQGLGVTAPRKRALHPGVKRVLRMLRDQPDCDTSLAALAREADLSPGRFMHAFTESMGIALRPYLLWRKLQRATFAVVTGRPLAEAAAFGGFSDGAHMTRAFRRMFGLTPSEMQRSQFVQAQQSAAP
jgi:AraC-like DNA-binding protein